MADPIEAAALAVAGQPEDGAPGRKTYPSPMKYKNNEWATNLNGFLDKAGDEEGILSTPASTAHVAECALATAETWGLNAEGKDVPIHPGWLLLFSVLAYCAMVAFVHFVKKKDTPPADPRMDLARRERLASLSQ